MIKLSMVGENFWEVHPMLKYRSPFVEIFNAFEDREESSKRAWAVCLFTDTSSDFRNMEEKIRANEIETYFLKEKGALSEEIMKFAIKAYPEAVLSENQQYLKIWGDKIRERAKFISDAEYTLDEYDTNDQGRTILVKGSADQLDKMLVNSPKILETFDKYSDKVKAEAGKGRVKGGRGESLSEQKKI